jgi:hypothetical protein
MHHTGHLPRMADVTQPCGSRKLRAWTARSVPGAREGFIMLDTIFLFPDTLLFHASVILLVSLQTF